MTSAEPLLQACEVSVRRPGEAGRLQPVLHALNLAVAAGEILAVVGPSGSGKSTLLRLFNRFLEPERGEIFFAGKNIQNIDPPSLRAQIPLVAQKPFLFTGTVRDNLQVPARLHRTFPLALNDPSIVELLELCQINPAWLDRDARKLSIGEQQRICLVRALLGPCRALLLDEPTSALDRPTANLMAKTFRQLASQKGLAIIFISHDIRLTERCADRIALLLDGTIIEEGLTDEILHRPSNDRTRQFLSLEQTLSKEAPG